MIWSRVRRSYQQAYQKGLDDDFLQVEGLNKETNKGRGGEKRAMNRTNRMLNDRKTVYDNV